MFAQYFLRMMMLLLLMGTLISCAEASKENSYINMRNLFIEPAQAPRSAVALYGGTASVAGEIAAPTSNSPAAPVALADVASNAPAPQRVQRIMIYQAGLGLVVANVAQTMDEIKHQTEAFGGYLQEINANAITVRVPAERFNDALASIERMGEVTDRHIKALDVTEEMRDLKIRLENAEAVRQRLTALLDKSVKMEDTLKIEQEHERVTQEIELMNGKIQYMQSQVAFSAIQVTLNSPLPQRQMVEQIPFAWVRDLADGLVSGTAEPAPDTSHWLARNARFILPHDYIRYFERDFITEAMSAQGMLIKLKRQDNYDGGDVAFWANLVRRALIENCAIKVDNERDIKLDSGVNGKLFIGSKEIAGKPRGYMVGVVVNKRHVYTFEAWGPKDQFVKDRADLEHALSTLDINW